MSVVLEYFEKLRARVLSIGRVRSKVLDGTLLRVDELQHYSEAEEECSC